MLSHAILNLNAPVVDFYLKDGVPLRCALFLHPNVHPTDTSAASTTSPSRTGSVSRASRRSRTTSCARSSRTRAWWRRSCLWAGRTRCAHRESGSGGRRLPSRGWRWACRWRVGWVRPVLADLILMSGTNHLVPLCRPARRFVLKPAVEIGRRTGRDERKWTACKFRHATSYGVRSFPAL